VVSGIGPADDALHEVLVVVACYQGAADEREEVEAAPGCLFAGFHDDGVTGKEGADDGGDEVVKGVVPADACGDDAEGLVHDGVFLIAHEKIRWSSRLAQSSLAVLDGPLQFLDCDEDLAETSVDLGLAAVETACCYDFFLVANNMAEKRSQKASALRERCLRPRQLGIGCFPDGEVDVFSVAWSNGIAKGSAVCRTLGIYTTIP
jgi:hypothetical protein